MKPPVVLICSRCGSVGKTKPEMQGSFAVELLLFFLFVIPGLIYGLWRIGSARKMICGVCGADAMIPLDSPTGKRMQMEAGNK